MALYKYTLHTFGCPRGYAVAERPAPQRDFRDCRIFLPVELVASQPGFRMLRQPDRPEKFLVMYSLDAARDALWPYVEAVEQGLVVEMPHAGSVVDADPAPAANNQHNNQRRQLPPAC